MLSGKLVERSAQYVVAVSSMLDADDGLRVSQTNTEDRMKQDNENLRKQLADKDAKASRLTQ